MLAWILIPLGVLMMVYAVKIQSFTGQIDFAEKIFGVGGTDTFIRLFGLAVTLCSIMWIAGGLPRFLQSVLGKYF